MVTNNRDEIGNDVRKSSEQFRKGGRGFHQVECLFSEQVDKCLRLEVEEVAQEIISLNERQTNLVRSLEFVGGQYSEILLFERSISSASLLRYRPATFEKWVNTTNPADIGRRDRLMREHGWSLEQAIRSLADEDERASARRRA